MMLVVNQTPLAAFAFAATAAAIVSSTKKHQAEKRCRALEMEVLVLQQRQLQLQDTNIKPITSFNTDGCTDVITTSKEKVLPPTSGNRKKQPPTVEEAMEAEGGLFVKRVGTIRSIYKLCVGTPRQGLLAPNARGSIELERMGDASTASSVIGLEQYSHIWILFVFHLNTKSTNPKRIKSKISPPALGGEKVGLFATRSPHRFNPIGITLCKIDRIEKISKTKHRKEKVVIHISGLDLVDGTPVLDIKPFVPIYDSVQNEDDVKLPSWVAGGLATQRPVIITQNAQNDLMEILHKDKHALQFYGPKYNEQSVEETTDYALQCIKQVLAMDVRSNFQTKKAREGKHQAERARRLQDKSKKGSNDNDDSAKVVVEEEEDVNVCTQQLDNLLIRYSVDKTENHQRSTSMGSGAEDTVTVMAIQLLNKGKPGGNRLRSK